MDDAVVAGFLEVVERDAVAIWWYNKIVRPPVEIMSFSDELIDHVAAQHRRDGQRLTVFDVTGDLNIPVFVAMSVGPQRDFPLLGFAAHFDARRALRHALTELGQALCFEEQERRKWRGFSWSRQRHLTDQSLPPRRTGDYLRYVKRPAARTCATAAARVGAEVLVRDCTRADVALACVKVIVPGFRGLPPRFGPGRLLDVPLRLGWVRERLARDALNTQYLRS